MIDMKNLQTLLESGKARIGKQVPHAIQPRLLSVSNAARYHGLYNSFHGGQAVVMFTDGTVTRGGDPAGTHDGLRDGQQGHTVDTRGNRVYYINQQAWLAEGLELPEE